MLSSVDLINEFRLVALSRQRHRPPPGNADAHSDAAADAHADGGVIVGTGASNDGSWGSDFDSDEIPAKAVPGDPAEEEYEPVEGQVRPQGCQIFLGTTCQNWEKNYRIATKCTKWT
jgi:hypothetical protein